MPYSNWLDVLILLPLACLAGFFVFKRVIDLIEVCMPKAKAQTKNSLVAMQEKVTSVVIIRDMDNAHLYDSCIRSLIAQSHSNHEVLIYVSTVAKQGNRKTQDMTQIFSKYEAFDNVRICSINALSRQTSRKLFNLVPTLSDCTYLHLVKLPDELFFEKDFLKATLLNMLKANQDVAVGSARSCSGSFNFFNEMVRLWVTCKEEFTGLPSHATSLLIKKDLFISLGGYHDKPVDKFCDLVWRSLAKQGGSAVVQYQKSYIEYNSKSSLKLNLDSFRQDLFMLWYYKSRVWKTSWTLKLMYVKKLILLAWLPLLWLYSLNLFFVFNRTGNIDNQFEGVVQSFIWMSILIILLNMDKINLFIRKEL